MRALQWSIHPSAGLDPGSRGLVVRFDDVTLANEHRARREHQARLSSLGEMAGGIAHELNTPLQALLLNADMAHAELGGGEPDLEFVQEVVAEAVATTRYLSNVVRAMRTLSRRSGSEGDPLETVPLREVIEDVCSMGSGRMRLAGVSVSVLAPEEIQVTARRSECAQILLNLLNNAHDAVAGLPDPWVRIELAREGERVRVSVVDSGPGVPGHLADAIMAPFYTTKAAGQGTGLGLSVSRTLAQQWGATFHCDSEAGHSSFTLTFSGTAT